MSSNESPLNINELREQLAGLERDASTLKQDLSRLRASANEAENGAMAAVRAGNDVAAREHLIAHERHADRAKLFEAELKVLTALIETCRETLSTIGALDRARTETRDSERPGRSLTK